MASVASEFVVFKGGLSLPLAPVLLLLDLEARGLQVGRDGEDITVAPASQLTDMDCDGITRWKRHLLALLSYEAPDVQ